jgi:hypothetical protein
MMIRWSNIGAITNRTGSRQGENGARIRQKLEHYDFAGKENTETRSSPLKINMCTD